MEKSTFGWVDFRVPRIMLASPGEFEFSRFNCIYEGDFVSIIEPIDLNNAIRIEWLASLVCIWYNIKSF